MSKETPPKKGRGRSLRNILREKRGDFGPQRGFTEEQIMALGERAYQWAYEALEDPSLRRLSLRKFWQYQHIHPDTPEKNWYRKYPKFKALCEEINRIIGTIREERMLYKELDVHRVAYSLHQFLPEYRKADEYQDDRIVKREQAKAKKIVEEFGVTGRAWFEKEKNNQSGWLFPTQRIPKTDDACVLWRI